jgi:hypothetical protein
VDTGATANIKNKAIGLIKNVGESQGASAIISIFGNKEEWQHNVGGLVKT